MVLGRLLRDALGWMLCRVFSLQCDVPGAGRSRLVVLGLEIWRWSSWRNKSQQQTQRRYHPWQMDFLLGRSSHAIFCQQPPSAARVHLHQRGRTLPPALWRLDFIDKRGSMCSVDVDSIHKTCALSLSLSARSLFSLSRSLALLALSLSLALSRSLSLSHVFFARPLFPPVN